MHVTVRTIMLVKYKLPIKTIKELGDTMSDEKFKECCTWKIKIFRKSISTASSRP